MSRQASRGSGVSNCLREAAIAAFPNVFREAVTAALTRWPRSAATERRWRDGLGPTPGAQESFSLFAVFHLITYVPALHTFRLPLLLYLTRHLAGLRQETCCHPQEEK